MIFGSKVKDANNAKCFRNGTDMYSWESKSPTWVAQVKLALFYRATGQSLPFGTYFFWIGCIVFFSHHNRTEPNRLSINTGYPLNVSQRTLSNYRSYRTLGFDPGVLDASQTHLPPERFSTHELDAWQKDPRIVPVYAVSLQRFRTGRLTLAICC